MSDPLQITRQDALIVIDVQNDFCPGGALAVPDGDQVVPIINRLMQHFKHVAFSQDWHPSSHKSFASAHPGKSAFETIEMPYGTQILWPDHCIAGSLGAEFHKDLNTNNATVIIRKGTNPEIDSYSTFFENDRQSTTGLAGYLHQRDVKRVFLTGLAYEYCVGFSALDAIKEGFTTFLISDAVGKFGNEDTETMRTDLTRAGVKDINSNHICG